MDEDSDYEEVVLIVSLPELSGTGLLEKAGSVTLSITDNQALTCEVDGLSFRGETSISLGSQLLLEKREHTHGIDSTDERVATSAPVADTRVVALTHQRANLACTQFDPKPTASPSSSGSDAGPSS